MSSDALEAALQPVRKYFRSNEVTPNTVLAAHMRALGLVPHGAPWKLAKEALRSGSSYADAARAGAGEGIGRSTEQVVKSTGPSRQAVAPTTTTATELTAARMAHGPMDWFPQRFEPGAIQGDGAKKLLGTPQVSLEELLVRETAQNSWDARAGEGPVEFTMNLRDVPAASVRVLRDEVFTGEASGTDLRRALAEDNIWVIEISDRGTVGLGGPVRNDRTVPVGSVTHFIDLVFNIGATKSDPTSGGTYGFGKSISYMVSELGAMVMWSRCETDIGVEDRLIASAIGEVFDQDGFRYTGRHWWGRTVEGRPEPLVGERARELAERLFATGFQEGELGTSLMILAPSLGAPGPEDDADVLVQSVLWNLWPKLVPDENGHQAMIVRVQKNGVDLPIPDPTVHPVLTGSVACLQAVRAVQNGQPPPASLFRTEVVEIKRYNETLGHLALTKFPVGPVRSDEEEDRSPSRWVTLMRHGAELVVRRMGREPLSEAGFQWAGVFKPTAAVDATFARSEPPAHDDWSPASLPNKVQRSQVKVALDKIRQVADQFVSPASRAINDRASISTAAVGDLLASFLGGVPGSAPSRRAGSGGGARSRRASISVEPVEWTVGSRQGWTLTKLRVEVAGGRPEGTPVSLKVRVGTDGGTERREQPDFVKELGWLDGTQLVESCVVRPDEPQIYAFEVRDDVAVDVVAAEVDGEGQ